MANVFSRLFRPAPVLPVVTLPAKSTEARALPVRQTRGAYLGATQSRLTLDWNTSLLSADQEILQDLTVLRARSRDLCKNNTYAARYLELVQVNAIGSKGIVLQARITDKDGTLNNDVNNTIEAAFEEWGKSASLDGKLSWLDIEQLAAKTVPQDGEVFIRLITGAPNKYQFALQVLDGDYLDHLYNRLPGKNGTGIINEIRQGVEIDEFGTPVAYHFWRGHPSEGRAGNRRIRVAADEIIHLYRPIRPHQTRGVPWLTPAMHNLKMLGELMIAELVAVRTAAAKMGFIKTAADNSAPYTPEDLTVGGALPREMMEASPGTITRLDPGDEFESWNPEHPGSSFDAFSKLILRGIAASLNVSYSSLTYDLSTENYSSARIGLLNERDYWRTIQHWFIRRLHERVYAKWLEAALLSGALQLGTKSAVPFQSVMFRPRGFQWVDPQKELLAYETAIGIGLNSRTRVLHEIGADVDEVFADLQREDQLAKKYNIDISGTKITERLTPPPLTPEPEPTNGQVDDAAQAETMSTEDES